MLCCLLAPDWIEDDGSQLLFYTSLLLPPLQLERQWPWMQRSYETMYGRLTSYLTKRLHIVGACNAILSTCSSFLQKVPFCSVIWNKYIQIPEKRRTKGASAFVFSRIGLQKIESQRSNIYLKAVSDLLCTCNIYKHVYRLLFCVQEA